MEPKNGLFRLILDGQEYALTPYAFLSLYAACKRADLESVIHHLDDDAKLLAFPKRRKRKKP